MKTKLTRPEQHYDMYEVWWDDAAGLRHGWMDRTEKPKPQMVISVGFLSLTSRTISLLHKIPMKQELTTDERKFLEEWSRKCVC